MSELVLKGLVLRTADYKESSRMLTVLTDNLGKLSVAARGATRIKSRIAAACQPMAFSEMTLSESREKYYLKEASTLETFPGITADLKNYALGCYFLELLDASCPDTVPEPEALSLGLNALWLLSEGKKNPKLVKSAFELRLMTLVGYQPEVEVCAACGRKDPITPSLDLRGGALYCRSCALENARRPMTLDTPSLRAIRYIVAAPRGREFSFRIGEAAQRLLSEAAEGYLKEQLERSFQTLDYYKGI
ncbi:MAG: DNA repair protein RecO [Oscillospiraceae bacterium]|nr:DNA repair protein RecO [Oscillospiraceae bacterium]